MRPYLLLTPGPLTTSETVKEAMLSDWCTWDEDYNVGIVEEIRKSLVEMATKHPEEYTSVLMQGSGTYCVEAVLGSALKQGDKLLIFSNGAYGNRMETDCGCDELFRRCAFGCAGARHRFPHQQCEQMYPGRTRFRLYHRPSQ